MRCSVHAQAIHSKCELQEDPCVQPANIDVVIVIIAGILYLNQRFAVSLFLIPIILWGLFYFDDACHQRYRRHW